MFEAFTTAIDAPGKLTINFEQDTTQAGGSCSPATAATGVHVSLQFAMSTAA